MWIHLGLIKWKTTSKKVKMEDDLKIKMEDDLKKRMEDDLKKKKKI